MERNYISEQLEQQLDSFDAAERSRALDELIECVDAGRIRLPRSTNDINLHCHTFYSYNAYGYSPSKFAWLARKNGFAVAGIVDFDVLDGLDEFLEAARRLNLKACVGLETRVFIPEFADKEINSPGEPGISYHMGVGFPTAKLTGSAVGFVRQLRQTSQQRNCELSQRVNAYLHPVELDYQEDVLKLTPAGNPTERHLCTAYARKAKAVFSDDSALAAFWSEKLATPAESIAPSLPEGKDLINIIRAKTMKQGGVGYVQPGAGSFPHLADANEFILAAGAIPTHTWLNGLSAGEKEIEQLLEVAMSTGVAALNIIPDRNYGPGASAEKLTNLRHVVAVAEELDLPVVVGTEMNSPGQKLVDSFSSKELAPLLPIFLKGAHIVYAHSVLQRQAQLGYLSKWANKSFSSPAEKNKFFQTVGQDLQPKDEERLSQFNSDTTPEMILAAIRDHAQSVESK